jgi:hypothetical protein
LRETATSCGPVSGGEDVLHDAADRIDDDGARRLFSSTIKWLPGQVGVSFSGEAQAEASTIVASRAARCVSCDRD